MGVRRVLVLLLPALQSVAKGQAALESPRVRLAQVLGLQSREAVALAAG
jgi:hypothetical protein